MNLDRRAVIKAAALKSFALFGQENSVERMKIFIGELESSPYPVEQIAKAFIEHNQTSKFAPTLADILEKCSRVDEADFLERFRRQGLSPYEMDVVDDDVYSVRELVGRGRCASVLAKDYHWLEKEVLARYRDLKTGFVQVKRNPVLDQAQRLPSGGYLLSPTEKKEGSILSLIKFDEMKIKKTV